MGLLDFLKKDEVERIKKLEQEILELKFKMKSLSEVTCRATKCPDNENGKCSLSKLVIKYNAMCEDVGFEDSALLEEMNKETAKKTIIITEG